MKRVSVIAVLGLLLVFVLVADAASYPQTGTAVTNAIIQNLDSSKTATLVIDYYDTQGNLKYENDKVTIPPKSVVEVKTENEPLSSGFSGAAIVSSDVPIAAITSIRYRQVPGASDGTTQGAYNGASEGSETLYFPSFWVFDFIISRFTVQNTENAVAQIEIDYFKRDGTFVGTKSDTLNSYGSKTYCGCTPSDWPGGSIPGDFVDGSITVRSTNGVKLAGASVATRKDSASAYQALTNGDQGTILYAPSSFRFNLGKSVSVNTPPVLLSAVNIQNTSSSVDAPITIEYYNRDTGAKDLSLDYTIPAGSAVGANNWNGGTFDWKLFKALGPDGDWDGSVKIISKNAIPLVGTGITQWGPDKRTTMYALIPQGKAANKLFLPAQYRLDYGTGSFRQWSSLNLQNVGTATVSANDILIEYVDTSGNVLASFTGGSLPGNLAAGAALGMNTNNGGDLSKNVFNSFGFNFIGGIVVSSTDLSAQFVATANIVYSDRASSYNAVPE